MVIGSISTTHQLEDEWYIYVKDEKFLSIGGGQ